MTVMDASALLAYLQGEPGSEAVEEALAAGASCGAANWSEVAQKITAKGRNWELSRALLAESFTVAVEPVTAEDGEWAAMRWVEGEGLSLADRLCMALGHRLERPIYTADREWGEDGFVQIR